MSNEDKIEKMLGEAGLSSPDTLHLSTFTWTPDLTGINHLGVVLLMGQDAKYGLYMSAVDATRLGVDLIKAAAAFELAEESGDLDGDIEITEVDE